MCHGTPIQYSCLGNPMDGGAWWAAVHGVAKSWTWLSDFTFHFPALEKEMATHSSVLAWRIPGTGEPGGLLSIGSHRVRHDWSNLAAAVHVSPCPEPPSHLPPPRVVLWVVPAPALSGLLHSLNLDWSSISHMVIYVLQCYSLKSSHPCLLPWSPKSVFYICVSFAILYIGSSLPSF